MYGTLSLDVTVVSSMRIYVYNIQKKITVQVEASDTLEVLKMKLHYKEGVDFSNMLFFYQGITLNVEDQTLAFYDIHNEAILYLSQILDLTIFDGRDSLTLSINSADTVKNLKDKYEKLTGIRCQEQVLILNKKPLGEDTSRLDLLAVTMDSELQCLRPDSGKEN